MTDTGRPAASALDVMRVRRQFPALDQTWRGQPRVYFDGPAGSQIPRRVADAVVDALIRFNANTHGRFGTSREVDELLARARIAGAAMFGAADPDTVVFGPNMTSLTFAFTRAVARTLQPGDEVVVTQLDHDANITPWVMAARDAGAVVRKVRFRHADTTLDLDDLARAIGEHTRWVAVGAASNATGTKNPLRAIAGMTRRTGALLFVDAVHYAPHELMDVAAWGCDVAVCSAYKFFGPHIGMMWGHRALLEELPSYRLRPVGDELPDRWMTGTASHEGIAGTLAAIEYIASLGKGPDLRAQLVSAFRAIEAHEGALLERLLAGLASIPAVTVWGVRDIARRAERVPTVAFTHRDLPAPAIAERLGERGIFVWDGNYYAVEVTRELGLDPDGMVRVGLLHYNTADEVDCLVDELRQL